MMQVIGIVNSKAGKGEARMRVEKTRARFRASEINLQIVKTKSPGHAAQIAKEYFQEGHRKFLCFGGDGTLNEIVNGLFENGIPEGIQVGVVPTGTGNSFIKDFDSHTMNLADKIIQNKTRPCDVIETVHTDGKLYWINIFSFGFTSNVGNTRQKLFRGIGSLGYTLAVLLELKRLSSFPVRLQLDNEVVESDSTFISINNTRYTGGKMMMAPEALPDDGLLDIVEARKTGKMELLRAFPRIFKGTHALLPFVDFYKTKTIQFDFQKPVDVVIDGEMKNIQPLSMKVLPKAIQIYA
jgi:YegS/Rv2252/BmrU family lipid kinase